MNMATLAINLTLYGRLLEDVTKKNLMPRIFYRWTMEINWFKFEDRINEIWVNTNMLPKSNILVFFVLYITVTLLLVVEHIDNLSRKVLE